MFQKIELRKTRDFSAKVNITFDFIRQNFKILAMSMIYISGPFIIIGGICSGLYQQKSLAGLGQGAFGNIFNEWYGVMIVFVLLGNVSSLIVVNEFVRLYELKEDPGTIELAEIWDGVKENFFNEAFTRSFNLITDKWWSTFGFLVVMFLIAGFMGYIFQLPQLIFTVVFALHKTTDSLAEPAVWEQVGIIVSSVISTIGSNLLQSIVFVAMIFQFYNLVERKEAQGLMKRLDSFGKTDVNAPRHDETF